MNGQDKEIMDNALINIIELICLHASSNCSLSGVNECNDCWLKSFIISIGSLLKVSDENIESIVEKIEVASRDVSFIESDKESASSVWSDLESDADGGQNSFVLLNSRASEVDAVLRRLYGTASKPKLMDALKMLLSELVSSDSYDSRARAALKDTMISLTDADLIGREECAIEASNLLLQLERNLNVGCNSELPSTVRSGKKNSSSRNFKIGAAAVGGGALLFYSGGIAAPAIAAASISAIGSAVTYMAPTFTSWIAANSLLASTVVTESAASYTAISSLFGATGASLAGYKMSKRTANVKEFTFTPLYEPRDEQSSGMSLFICVSGWFEKKHDVRNVWGGYVSKSVASLDGSACSSPKSLNSCDASPSQGPSYDSGALQLDELDWEVYASSDDEETLRIRKCGQLYRLSSKSANSRSFSFSSEGSWEELPREGWWRSCIRGAEEYALLWETEALSAFTAAIRELAWQSASRRILGEFLRRSHLWPILNAASIPLALLNAAAGLDDPWAVALKRSKECGRLLAEVLLSHPTGSKPVTLIGYSMGARVILSCLETLAKSGANGYGIVESAVLLGIPSGKKPKRWRRARSVVARRLVNVYSTQDFVLALMYRTKCWKVGVAGISPVNSCAVENIDVSHLLTWHLNYPKLLPYVMTKLKLE